MEEVEEQQKVLYPSVKLASLRPNLVRDFFNKAETYFFQIL